MKRGAGLLGGVALTFFGLLLATFLIGRVVPIDPVLAVVGDRASAETYAQARTAMGLDQPLWQQFAHYVGAVLRGDFGRSVVTANPVREDLARVFPATMELATAALALGVALGVPAGIWASVRQNRWQDHAIRLIGLVGHSVPVFWLGLVALLLFYARLGWVAGPGQIDAGYEDIVVPISGLVAIDAFIAGRWDIAANAAAHLVLPAAILGAFSVASISRFTRGFMLEQLRQDYVVAARAKGLSEARIIWRHALGNAAVPLVTVVALSYAGLLEGSVLTETVFAWPGIGSYITASLLSADMNAVLGGTLVVGTVFIGLNLAADLLYRVFDPRVR